MSDRSKRSLAQWLSLQEQMHPQTIDLGLGRVGAVARTLGLDRPACPVITVGGTNGKGSTVAFLDALLGAAGLSRGMFTSPHFLRYNERIRVDGTEVSDDELVAAFERIEAARGAVSLTFFEYNTLAALAIFAERRVQAMVLEVGLGGRLDATNLIDADVAIVCSIGFDHREYLGDTLEAIGREKAGIFRPGRPAVLGTDDMPASVYAVIEAIGAHPVVAGRDFGWQVDAGGEGTWSYRGIRHRFEQLPRPALAGPIQYRNAATALAALETLTAGGAGRSPQGAVDLALGKAAVARGLATARLAGRFQIVPGPGGVEWILDIAHNEPAAQVLAAQVRERPRLASGRRTWAVAGILRDKDAPAIVRAMRGVVDHWILCALEGPRGGTAAALAERSGLPSGQVSLAGSVPEGCALVRERARAGDRVLVFGSVHTVGPALEWLGIY